MRAIARDGPSIDIGANALAVAFSDSIDQTCRSQTVDSDACLTQSCGKEWLAAKIM